MAKKRIRYGIGIMSLLNDKLKRIQMSFSFKVFDFFSIFAEGSPYSAKLDLIIHSINHGRLAKVM